MLRKAHRALFHPTQDWFEHERFAHAEFFDGDALPPLGGARIMGDGEPDADEKLVSAVHLVAAYVTAPHLTVWRDYLWTASRDDAGQRVYVGGTANGRGFEIHRHLSLGPRWRVPVW